MISVETVDGVAVVRLDHGKVNALDIELCQAVTATFHSLEAQAVVLTGAGSAFSAGVDLWRILDGGDDYVVAFIPALVEAFAAERAVARARHLATAIPPATYAATKRYLNRLPGFLPYDEQVVRLWQERAADGWIAGYLQRTIKRQDA